MKNLQELKRILFDVVIIAVLAFVLYRGHYTVLPGPLQLLAMKIILVSIGFLHAHITRKLAFPSVDWSDDNSRVSLKFLITVLYAAFIYAYAQGG